jgi:hypothetical protein
MDILAAINHLSSSKSPPHKQHLPCPINQNLWDNLGIPDDAFVLPFADRLESFRRTPRVAKNCQESLS